MKKEVITTANAPGAVGPYVQAIKANGMVYCSGQLGINLADGKLPETVEEQTHFSMKNMGAILREAGSDYADGYPARSCFQVAKLPLGGLVEIECIACS